MVNQTPSALRLTRASMSRTPASVIQLQKPLSAAKIATLSSFRKWKANQCARADPIPPGEFFEVYCNDKTGQLHRNKFGSGSRGKCIEVNGGWFTPYEFEELGGRGSNKSWKLSLRYGATKTPLNVLVDAGFLVEHNFRCGCSVCIGHPSTDRIRYRNPRRSGKRPAKAVVRTTRLAEKEQKKPGGDAGTGSEADGEVAAAPNDSQTHNPVSEVLVLNDGQPEASIAERFEELDKLAQDFIKSSQRFNDVVTAIKASIEPLKRENETLKKDLEEERTLNAPLREKIKHLESMVSKQALVVLNDEYKKRLAKTPIESNAKSDARRPPVSTHDAITQAGPSPLPSSDGVPTLQQESVSSTGVHADIRPESVACSEDVRRVVVGANGVPPGEDHFEIIELGDEVIEGPAVWAAVGGDDELMGASHSGDSAEVTLRCSVCNAVTLNLCAACQCTPFCSGHCLQEGAASHRTFCDETVAAMQNVDASTEPMELERPTDAAFEGVEVPIGHVAVSAVNGLQSGYTVIAGNSLSQDDLAKLLVDGKQRIELRNVTDSSGREQVAYVIYNDLIRS